MSSYSQQKINSQSEHSMNKTFFLLDYLENEYKNRTRKFDNRKPWKSLSLIIINKMCLWCLTFNNSSVILEETGVRGENHRPAASH